MKQWKSSLHGAVHATLFKFQVVKAYPKTYSKKELQNLLYMNTGKLVLKSNCKGAH